MLKLARRARGHFVRLIEIRVHLIRVKPGHISTLVGSELQPEDFWGLRNFALSILTITYPEPGQQIFDYMYDTISGFLTSGSWYFSLA